MTIWENRRLPFRESRLARKVTQLTLLKLQNEQQNEQQNEHA